MNPIRILFLSTMIFAGGCSNNSKNKENPTVEIKAPTSYVLAGTPYAPEIFINEGIPLKTRVEITSTAAQINTQKDKISFQVPTKEEGLHLFTGNVFIANENGEEIKLPFKSEYMVAKPAIAVSSRILIKGIDNEIQASAAGIPPYDIIVESSQGQLKEEKGIYLLNPTHTGECIVTLIAKINGKLDTLGTQKFMVFEKK